MRSTKHSLGYYALSGVAASAYTLLAAALPHHIFFWILLGLFFLFTSPLFLISPSQFLLTIQTTTAPEDIGLPPLEKRSCGQSSSTWRYFLGLACYLVTTGTVSEIICGLGGEGGDWVEYDPWVAKFSRIWLFHQALAFIIIGLLEPIRQNVSNHGKNHTRFENCLHSMLTIPNLLNFEEG